jgi:hypothetical protein
VTNDSFVRDAETAEHMHEAELDGGGEGLAILGEVDVVFAMELVYILLDRRWIIVGREGDSGTRTKDRPSRAQALVDLINLLQRLLEHGIPKQIRAHMDILRTLTSKDESNARSLTRSALHSLGRCKAFTRCRPIHDSKGSVEKVAASGSERVRHVV